MEANQQKEIPNPPGGGSWIFNESTWQWESNNPVPPPTETEATADVAAAPIEQEQ